jgi:hypothetical protein
VETPKTPMSHTVLLRVALDVLIGGLLAGMTIYSATNQLKTAVLGGLAIGLKTLQSAMSPNPEEMTRQRQAEKSAPPG